MNRISQNLETCYFYQTSDSRTLVKNREIGKKYYLAVTIKILRLTNWPNKEAQQKYTAAKFQMQWLQYSPLYFHFSGKISLLAQRNLLLKSRNLFLDILGLESQVQRAQYKQL